MGLRCQGDPADPHRLPSARGAGGGAAAVARGGRRRDLRDAAAAHTLGEGAAEANGVPRRGRSIEGEHKRRLGA